jgi:uncharacterized protein YybS (DUF2232 family)
MADTNRTCKLIASSIKADGVSERIDRNFKQCTQCFIVFLITFYFLAGNKICKILLVANAVRESGKARRHVVDTLIAPLQIREENKTLIAC